MKIMKILTFTLLVGCLAAVSVGTRPKQNAYAEEDATFSDREQEQEEVVISDINRNRAVQLVAAIRAQHRSTRGQHAVMCLIPITSPELTFNDLLLNNYCTGAITPASKSDHSEPKALRQWDNLREHQLDNPAHANLQYDIFLYSYLSPCNDCARSIVSVVETDWRLGGYEKLRAFYIAYSQPYEYKGKSTLKATQGIFNKHNNNAKDPGGNPTKKIILFDQFKF